MTPKEKIIEALMDKGPMDREAILKAIGMRGQNFDNCIGGLMKNKVVVLARGGVYQITKSFKVLEVLDENGPCFDELLKLELKSKGMSRKAVNLIDRELQAMLNGGFITINKDGAYTSPKWA
jgi:hypothetical protein